MTQDEARTMFREYLDEGCEMAPAEIANLYQDRHQVEIEWTAWLRQTQVENGFVDELEARGWTPGSYQG